jgi:hypothetical protein
MTYTAQATFVGRNPDTVDDLINKANQIYQLARIGYLAEESVPDIGITHPEAAFCGLFEVMARLADEIRGELDEIADVSPELRRAFETATAAAKKPEGPVQ